MNIKYLVGGYASSINDFGDSILMYRLRGESKFQIDFGVDNGEKEDSDNSIWLYFTFIFQQGNQEYSIKQNTRFEIEGDATLPDDAELRRMIAYSFKNLEERLEQNGVMKNFDYKLTSEEYFKYIPVLKDGLKQCYNEKQENSIR